MRFMRFTRGAVCVLAVVFCVSAMQAAEETKPAPYAESIPGTLVKFDMVPIPAGEITMPDLAKPGAKIKVKIGSALQVAGLNQAP